MNNSYNKRWFQSSIIQLFLSAMLLCSTNIAVADEITWSSTNQMMTTGGYANAYWIEVQTPSTWSGDYYLTSFSLYTTTTNGTPTNPTYLAICSSGASSNTLSTSTILGVSDVNNTASEGLNKYTFSKTVKLTKGTSYYLYFLSSADISASSVSIAYQRIGLSNISTTALQIYGNDGKLRTTWTPIYSATLTSDGSGSSGGGSTGSETTTTTGNEDKIDGVSQTLYKNISSDYPWRIPSIARAYNGDLIALGGYLGCGTDIGWGRCDVYGRISPDNGKTWGDKFAIAEGTGDFGVRTTGTLTNDTCGYGDAAIVGDRTSNKVLIMSCTGGYSYGNSTRNSSLSTVLRTARYYGNYDTTAGTWTWTSPVDVTKQIYDLVPNVNKLFVGSGKICQSRQIKVGDYYRVYIALCTNLGNYVLYSDDFGTTWKNLGSSTTSCASGGDEPKCEELPNGNVVLSSRTSSGRIFNIFTYSDQSTAAGSWASAVYSYNYSGGISYGSNACNGEILMVDAIRKSDNTQVTLALQSVPTGDSRSNVKIFYKELSSTSDYDTPAHFAAGWDGSYQVSSTTSAYSTMCQQADNRIGFFFEESYTTAVKFGDGYNLVYYRYPLETITGNTYSLVYNIPDAQTYNVGSHGIVADKVTYSRTISNAGTYTVCLPFSLTADQAKAQGITKIEQFTAADSSEGTVTFTDVTDKGITAFTPCIITCSAGALNSVVLTDQKLSPLPSSCSTTFDGVSFTGNFTYHKSMDGLYGFTADGKGFALGSSNAYINAFRAYLNTPSGTSGTKVFTMTHLDTGIASTHPDASTTSVYTLDGRCIRRQVSLALSLKGLQPGIYIINHKKIVIE